MSNEQHWRTAVMFILQIRFLSWIKRPLFSIQPFLAKCFLHKRQIDHSNSIVASDQLGPAKSAAMRRPTTADICSRVFCLLHHSQSTSCNSVAQSGFTVTKHSKLNWYIFFRIPPRCTKLRLRRVKSWYTNLHQFTNCSKLCDLAWKVHLKVYWHRTHFLLQNTCTNNAGTVTLTLSNELEPDCSVWEKTGKYSNRTN